MTEIVEKLKTLFSLSAQPVFGAIDGRVVFANPAVFNVMNRDIIGMKSADILPEHIVNDTSESFIASGMLDKRPASVAATVFEGVRVYSFTLTENGHILSIAPFVASLRSSAFTIRLAVDQITEKIETRGDEKLEAYISSLYRSYFTILRLTVNLDTADRLANGTLEFNPRIYDVVALISDMISSLSHFMPEDSAEISFSCREPRVLCNVDSVRLEQLLLNLLSNSIMHTSSGDRISVMLHDSDDKIIISVDDTGSGVRSEILGNVFSRYTQRYLLSDMPSELGLGLSIARGIAEIHGGALIIESRMGMGTSVRVMLPKNLDMTSGIKAPVTPEHDMSRILREMAGIIPGKFYTNRYLD